MKKRKILAAVLSALAAWMLLLSMLLMGVFVCTTSRSFYRHEYKKYGQAQTIGIDDDSLMAVTNALLDYLWGSRDTLDMQMAIGGELREVFTQREKDHMVDVRALISLARTVMVASLVAGIGLWVGAALLAKGDRRVLRASGIGYLAGAGVLLVAVGVVVLLALRDFTAVFIRFHEIFFTNDLWLLNADDMLIMMVPEPFFADCAALIAALFAVGLALTAAIAAVLIVRGRGKGKPPEEDWELTAVTGGDGDQYYRIPEGEEERPDASEIFARLGLDDDDGDDLPVQRLVPQKEPDTYRPPQPPSPLAQYSAEFPLHLDSEELSVRFEMQLDLKVEKAEDGRLTLKMDPARRPQISLTSLPGQLSFTVNDEPAPQLEAPEFPTGEDAGAAGRAQRIVEPAPTPEELLRQMDELMKGFPQCGKEGSED